MSQISGNPGLDLNPNIESNPSAMVRPEEQIKRDVSYIAIQEFLISQGWPELYPGSLAAECALADVTCKVRKDTVCIEPQAMSKLLYSMAEVPFVDPNETILVADISRELGHGNSTRLSQLLYRKNNQYTEYLVERRLGGQPGVYRRARALKIPGAILLATDGLRRDAKRGKQAEERSPEEIITAIQAERRQYMGEHHLKARLDPTAIDSFMVTVVALASKCMHSTEKRPTKQMLTQLSHLLDPAALRLSGTNWRLSANCLTADPDTFIETTGDDVEEALAYCRGCRVKADCLLDSLQNNSVGTAGGLRNSERQKLLPFLPDVERWLRRISGTPTKPIPSDGQKIRSGSTGNVTRA